MTAVHDLDARLAPDPYVIGLPGATDIDFGPIAHLLTNRLLINVGDPRSSGVGRRSTDALECEVHDQLVAMFGGNREDWWGYIASGTSLAVKHAIRIARDTLPRRRKWGKGPVIYASTAAHPCVAKAAHELQVPLELIPARYGSMDIDELRALTHPGRPAILVPTIGTTGIEAVDDAAAARAAVLEMGAHGVWVHADAALAGLPRALQSAPPSGARLDSGVLDSLSISGHKFLGTPASAWFVMRTRWLFEAPTLPYTGDVDNTPEGCRRGQDALCWWYVLDKLGPDGLRERAETSRYQAALLEERLAEVGVRSWRHDGAFTVVLLDPPPVLVKKYGLATYPRLTYSGIPRDDHRIGHVVTMPGVKPAVLDEFVADMAAWS